MVDPVCRKTGPDDIDAVQRKHRNEQMALDSLAQLVPDRAQPEFGLERPECGLQFSQPPVGTNRILNAPPRVAGAQDIMVRSGIVRMIRRIAFPGNGPGLAVRGLRDGNVIVVVDQGVPFPQPPKPLNYLVVFPGAARLAQPFVQVSKIGFEAFTLLRQNGLILFLTGLAPDAQLRLVLMVMRQSPDPHLMPRTGVNRCIGIPCVHTVHLIRFNPAPLDGDPVITPFAQLGEVALGGDAGVHNDRRLVLALILCGKAVQRVEKRAGFADIARQYTGSAWESALIRGKSQRDQGTIVPLLPGTSNLASLDAGRPVMCVLVRS